MHFGIGTWGSDGDILPYLALARGLVAAGHKATLMIRSLDGKDYSTFSQSHLDIVQIPPPFGANPHLLDSVGSVLIGERETVRQLMLTLEALGAVYFADVLETAYEVCRNSDIVVAHHLFYPLRWIAEQADLPCINVSLYPVPLQLTGLAPHAYSFSWWYCPDTASGRQQQRAWEYCRQHELDRRDRNPSQARAVHSLNLVAVSRILYQPLQDWDNREHLSEGSCARHTGPSKMEHGEYVCGCLDAPRLCKQWGDATSELRAFLEAGEPPFYMTFGSLLPRERGERMRLVQLFVAAADLAECRAIIQVPREDLQTLHSDERIFFNPPIYYGEVFPRCLAVVHHGGAGTTHAALRAGCPSVVINCLLDQMFWGRRLFELGLGPHPLHFLDLNPECLAQRMRTAAASEQMCRKARCAGEEVSGEDGISEAIRVIGTWLNETVGRS